MSARHPFSLLLIALSTTAVPAHAAERAFDEVVAAERAFAQASHDHGMRAAFEQFMLDDTVIYRGGPVAGRPFYARAPEAKFDLEWGPDRAGVAASGDLGFTTGPARYFSQAEKGKLLGAGHFLSVWQRDEAGKFHNMMDLGVEHADQPLAKDVVQQGPAPSTVAPRLASAAFNARLQALLNADRELASKLAGTEGQAALLKSAAPEAVVLRDGAGPVAVAQAKLDAAPLPRMELAAIRVSAAGDLGATSGWNGDPKAQRAYIRVWRWTEQGWRVIADVLGG